jgi:hypothetical protein
VKEANQQQLEMTLDPRKNRYVDNNVNHVIYRFSDAYPVSVYGGCLGDI